MKKVEAKINALVDYEIQVEQKEREEKQIDYMQVESNYIEDEERNGDDYAAKQGELAPMEHLKVKEEFD